MKACWGVYFEFRLRRRDSKIEGVGKSQIISNFMRLHITSEIEGPILFLHRFDPAASAHLKLHLPTVVNHSSDMMCLKERVTVDMLTLDRFTSLGLNPTWDIADVFKNLGKHLMMKMMISGNVLLTGCQTILSRKNNRSILQNGTRQILSTLDLYLQRTTEFYKKGRNLLVSDGSQKQW